MRGDGLLVKLTSPSPTAPLPTSPPQERGRRFVAAAHRCPSPLTPTLSHSGGEGDILEGCSLSVDRDWSRRFTCDAENAADLGLDLTRDVGVLFQVLARVVLALADAVLAVGVPRARFLDDAVEDAQLDDLAFARNAFAVEDVEFGVAERRRDLVLDHFRARLGPDHFLAFLDRAHAPDVDAHRRVELEGVAAGGRLGVAEHHADLHADLIDEDHERVR